MRFLLNLLGYFLLGICLALALAFLIPRIL